MKNKNEVVIVGNLGQEPEIVRQEGNKSRCTFSVATKDSYKNEKGDWVDTPPQWHDCIAWGKTAEKLADTLVKGDPVHLTGKLKYSEYHPIDGNSYKAKRAQVEVFEVLPLVKEKPSKTKANRTPRDAAY